MTKRKFVLHFVGNSIELSHSAKQTWIQLGYKMEVFVRYT